MRKQVQACRGIKLDTPDFLQSGGALFPVFVSNLLFARCFLDVLLNVPFPRARGLLHRELQFRRIRYMPAGAAKLSAAASTNASDASTSILGCLPGCP